MALLVRSDAGQSARRLWIASARETLSRRVRRGSLAKAAILPGFEREGSKGSFRRTIEARWRNQGAKREPARPSRRERKRGRCVALLIVGCGDRVAAQIRRGPHHLELGGEPEESGDRSELGAGIVYPARGQSFVG